MKKENTKKNKVVIVIVAMIVVVIGIFAFWYPRMIMHSNMKELVQECESGNVVTDFSLKAENVFTVSNQNFSVDIPEGFVSYEAIANSIMEFYQSGEKSFAIFKQPSVLQMSLINPQDEDSIGGDIEPEKLNKMVEKLGYGTPDCYYNIMKAAILLNKEDYSFWSKDKQIAFGVIANVKKNIFVGREIWNYERDDVRAIVSKYEGTQNYIIEAANEQELNAVYSIYLNNVEEEDVWKLLNSLKFQ